MHHGIQCKISVHQLYHFSVHNGYKVVPKGYRAKWTSLNRATAYTIQQKCGHVAVAKLQYMQFELALQAKQLTLPLHYLADIWQLYPPSSLWLHFML